MPETGKSLFSIPEDDYGKQKKQMPHVQHKAEDDKWTNDL